MRHLSTRALARYSAGAFGLRKAARITAHLAHCQRCSALLAHLTSLSRMLANVAPTHMPNHLADRLSKAIADESARRAARMSAAVGTAPAGGAAVGTETEVREPDRAVPGRPDLPARRRHAAHQRRRPGLSSPVVLRGLAAAAAVAIVAGAGYLFTSRSPSTAGGTAAPTARAPVRASGTPAGAQKSAVNIPYGASNGSAQSAQQVAHTVPVLTSATDYTKANLAAQVRESVASVAPGKLNTSISSPQRSTAGGVGSLRLIDGLTAHQLTGCLTGIANGRRVLVADVAKYLGKPATIIVLASLSSVNVLDVIVVGLACSASHEHVIAMTTVSLR